MWWLQLANNIIITGQCRNAQIADDVSWNMPRPTLSSLHLDLGQPNWSRFDNSFTYIFVVAAAVRLPQSWLFYNNNLLKSFRLVCTVWLSPIYWIGKLFCKVTTVYLQNIWIHICRQWMCCSFSFCVVQSYCAGVKTFPAQFFFFNKFF